MSLPHRHLVSSPPRPGYGAPHDDTAAARLLLRSPQLVALGAEREREAVALLAELMQQTLELQAGAVPARAPVKNATPKRRRAARTLSG